MIKSIIHSDILAENPVPITPSSAWLNGGGRNLNQNHNQNLTAVYLLLLILLECFDLLSPSEQAEEGVKNRESSARMSERLLRVPQQPCF